MKIDLKIENHTAHQIPAKAEITQAILDVLLDKGYNINVQIGLKVVNENEIQALNSKYRSKDAPTDVLSFPILDKVPKESEEPVLLGDIVICPACATEDFLFLVKHSALHLLGSHHKE